MISTTAVVSGYCICICVVNTLSLQCLELLKTLQPGKQLSAYKNAFVNLALPLLTFSEPVAAKAVKIREGWSWTLWDHIDISGDITLQGLLDYMKVS